jgi:PmbA protein
VSFFDLVEEEVRSFRAGDVRAADYQIALGVSTRAELGIESNRAGSPYRPLSVTDLAGGRFVIQWSDGLVSRGSLSRAGREGVREVLAAAFEGRYDDPDAAVFAGPAEVREIPLHAESTAAVADGRAPEALPGLLAVLEAQREKHGAQVLDGSARASLVTRRVVTSSGFRAEVESTLFGWSFALDSLVWDGHESREVPSDAAVAERAERTAADHRALSQVADESPRGAAEIVLHPRVAEMFLDTFLFPNLSGGAVANGRSRFSAGDFREGKRVFREDFGVSILPHEPMSVGSFRFTDEGVPSRAFDLVDGGCLTTPTLNLKYGKRLDLPPAPVPDAVEGVNFSLADERAIDEVVSQGPPRIVVHSVLGLHTQDAVRGEYSVLAPQGVLYRDGKVRGRVSATLNGSFFEDLAGPDLALVRFPGFACPGILTKTTLS